MHFRGGGSKKKVGWDNLLRVGKYRLRFSMLYWIKWIDADEFFTTNHIPGSQNKGNTGLGNADKKNKIFAFIDNFCNYAHEKRDKIQITFRKIICVIGIIGTKRCSQWL